MKKYLLILIIGLFAFAPDVPNTNSFRFSQVTMAVYGDSAAGRNLTSAFADATGTFDPSYVGGKTNLLNFRNYRNIVGGTVKYGYLYNWYATQGDTIAASGWHMPTISEYRTMIAYLGDSLVSGGKLKEAGFTYWSTPNTDATNDSKFNARAGGVRSYFSYNSKDYGGYYWNISVIGGSVYKMIVYYNSAGIEFVTDSKETGFSIRFLKNSTSLSNGQAGTYTGNDGRIYNTICIGTQEWLSENLAETKYRAGATIPTVTNQTTWNGLTTGAKCAYDNDESNVLN